MNPFLAFILVCWGVLATLGTLALCAAAHGPTPNPTPHLRCPGVRRAALTSFYPTPTRRHQDASTLSRHPGRREIRSHRPGVKTPWVNTP